MDATAKKHYIFPHPARPNILECDMKSDTFACEAEVEEHHWWFVGRRRLFGDVLSGLPLSQNAPILDVGTSTGTNLRMLRELGYTNVTGVDLNDDALRFCQAKGFQNVRHGNICALPFEENTFDLVLATDIIEHVDDDDAALKEVLRVVRPGGAALITVPAFTLLWGPQDVVAEHRRRYRMGNLRERAARAGWTIQESFYFNYLLFFPIFFARKILQLFRVRLRSENDVNTPLMNRVLTKLFSWDVRTASVLHPPFGVSILAVCKKNASSPSADVAPVARAA